MKKNLFLIISVFTFYFQKAYCFAEAMSPEIKDSLKTSSNDVNATSVVFSLVFVVLLIYVTGLIYNKLNMFGAKTVKERYKNATLNKVLILSTTQLGQGRDLHVIELNDMRYLIGSANNSISLLKELSAEPENETEDVKVTEDDAKEIDNAIEVLYSNSNKETGFKEVSEEEFSVHKKYL